MERRYDRQRQLKVSRMNVPITEIPTDEMIRDRDESEADIKICQTVLACGVTHHRDGLPVRDRINSNRQIIKRIDAELARRQNVNA